MPPDPQRLADTESWLRKASNDLRCAEIDLAAEPPAPEDAGLPLPAGSGESSESISCAARCAIP